MPIDVSYAPFARSLPGWGLGPIPVGPLIAGSHMPGSGPARAVDCLPAPNHCLPNGLRNPWAPYSGGSYQPASAAVTHRQIHPVTRQSPALSAGAGGSVITPSHLVGLGAPGSLIAPSGASLLTAGLGGLREDDGWNGSAGRDHRGIEPDMTSTSGALGPLASGGTPSAATSWMSVAPSPANHVPLSAARHYSPSPLVLGHSSPRLVPGYTQPGESMTYVRPRRHSIRPATSGVGPPHGNGHGSQNDCAECASRSRVAAPAGGTESPYRKVGIAGQNSPARGSLLKPERELPLSRKVSLRSRHSGGTATPPSRHCSECSAAQGG